MSLLWNPFRLGPLTLRNRLVMAPISTGLATAEGLCTEEQISFYRERAGSAGLIILEPGVVEPSGRLFRYSMGLWNEDQAQRLARLVEEIKKKGAAVIIQLCHSGPRTRAEIAGAIRPAPSDQRFFFDEPVEPLSRDGISRLKDHFRQAARRAVAAGCDGVEVHAAHFYLLSAFLSPLTNTRRDDYGQTAEGRARIVSEILQEIRQEVGRGVILGVRYHGWEPPGGVDAELAGEYAKIFAQAGADYLSISAFINPAPALQGKALVPASSAPDKSFPPGCYRPWIRAVKRTVNLPVIGVGKLDEPEEAEAALRSNDCDLVAVGRGFIADPHWPENAQAGNRRRKCKYCNYCLTTLTRGKLQCVQDVR